MSTGRRTIDFGRVVLLTLLILSLAAILGCGEKGEEFRLVSHVRYLADDAREGRGIGTDGLDQAAEYIASQFIDEGLEPAFAEDGYFQPFTMSWGANILDGCKISTTQEAGLTLYNDFQPLGFSGVGEMTAPALFVGYGITAPEYDYDDYAEVDATGKIVVVLTDEPAPDNEESKFSGTYATDHSTLRTKAINAKNHSAAGLIVVERFAESGEDKLPTLKNDEPYRDVGIPAIQVTQAGFAKLFPDMKLQNAQRSIDRNESPRSMPLGNTDVAMAVNLERGEVPVRNVGGVIRGSDTQILVGAHYDHLGYGQMGSNVYGVHEVHNGADDNASGVSVLIELARELAQNPPGPTVWFVAFTGEEVGLVGSGHFVNNSPVPLDSLKFMLNLDMVGRMQEDKLTVYGVHSAEGLMEASTKAAEGLEIEISQTGGGYGASDQTSFYGRGVPVAHLMTSLHEDYHSPKDDWRKINGKGMVKVLGYAEALVRVVSNPETELVYVKQEPPQQGGRGNIKVTFGIIPDFTQPDSLRGLRLQGVRTGTPADKAGLMEKDIVLKVGDVIIDNIYDFTFALKRHNPGDQAEVLFIRDGEEMTTTVTFAESRGRGGRPSGGGHGK